MILYPLTAKGEMMSALSSKIKKDCLVLVLAGGRGTRLKSLTDDQSKPAVPFGCKFRIIDFPLSNCLNSGMRKICVLTQYKAHSLIKHIQRGWSFLLPELHEFIELWPAQQQLDDESWYQGTADAVYQNLAYIKEHKPKYVLILAGDHIYKQDYSIMLKEHIDSGAEVSVSCIDVPIEEGKHFGIVKTDENKNVIDFMEKPKNPPSIIGNPNRAYASMGIYIFNMDFLENILQKDALNPDSSHDFGKDLMPKFAKEGGCNFIAHDFNNSCVFNAGSQDEVYWRDVGTLDSYWLANMDLARVVPKLDIYDKDWPIWTFQHQRPPAKFVFDDDGRRGMALNSLISSGCIISGGTVRRSLLFTDVSVHSYAEVNHSVILTGCDVGRGARLSKVILAEDCKIPRGLVIGEDKEEDAKRFFVSEGGITLVTPKMLENLKV